MVRILILLRILSVLLIGFLLVVSTVSTARADSTQPDLRNQVLDPAVNYLYVNYNETIGLNYNSPDTTELHNTYWVYSDNYLASLVLGTYDPDNTALTSRAKTITNKMEDYLHNHGITDPMNQYQVLNESVFYFHCSDPKGTLLEEGDDGAVVKTHINNLTGDLGSENYSDIAFLQVVYYHRLNESGKAMTAYLNGLARYDGKGFADNAFAGEYQTYKLALYIYASKLLGQGNDEQAFDTLLAMQQPDGGFKTGYDSSLNATSQSRTNMETTSLAVLSLMTVSAKSADDGVCSSLAIAAILVIASAAIVAVAYILIRRKRAIPPQTPITPPRT